MSAPTKGKQTAPLSARYPTNSFFPLLMQNNKAFIVNESSTSTRSARSTSTKRSPKGPTTNTSIRAVAAPKLPPVLGTQPQSVQVQAPPRPAERITTSFSSLNSNTASSITFDSKKNTMMLPKLVADIVVDVRRGFARSRHRSDHPNNSNNNRQKTAVVLVDDELVEFNSHTPTPPLTAQQPVAQPDLPSSANGHSGNPTSTTTAYSNGSGGLTTAYSNGSGGLTTALHTINNVKAKRRDEAYWDFHCQVMDWNRVKRT